MKMRYISSSKAAAAILALTCKSVEGFFPSSLQLQRTAISFGITDKPFNRPPFAQTSCQRRHYDANYLRLNGSSNNDKAIEAVASEQPKHTHNNVKLLMYRITGISTAAAWIQCSLTALKSHPDPALEAICGLRHNVLTMGQAFCLPLPLLISVFSYLITAAAKEEGEEDVTSRRLNLGLGVCSAWLGSAALFTPLFSCGYTLYSKSLQYTAASIHYFTSVLCFWAWWSSISISQSTNSKNVVGARAKVTRLIHGVTGSIWSLIPKNCSDNPNTKEGSDGRNEYATCTILFGIYSIMPLVSSFPLATIPVILGRRLSRAASAFTFLAAVVSYSLKDAIERGETLRNNNYSKYAILRKGLGVGSLLHVTLVALKLIGVDDGGFLLPGDGLRKVYSMMLQAPFAGVVGILMYCLAVFAGAVAS